MKISAVIPTRNRPIDICDAVASILEQSRRPDELLVIDQSDDLSTRNAVEEMMADEEAIELIYVYNPAINGLVEAREVSVQHATGDVICFLEDDVVLDKDYIASMEGVFREYSEIMGVCGVVTQGAKTHPVYRWFFHLFHRGIFHDPRVGIHGLVEQAGSDLIQSDYLSGGVSAYRNEVFEKVPYDTVNGFHMLEDIDFSTRAAEYYGKQNFFINPGARLVHNFSPLGRDRYGQRYQRKLREFLVFYKKRCNQQGATLSLLWLLVGLTLEAIVVSVAVFQLSPLVGTIKGVIEGVRQPVITVNAL